LSAGQLQSSGKSWLEFGVFTIRLEFGVFKESCDVDVCQMHPKGI
jgi:hypothetical protein